MAYGVVRLPLLNIFNYSQEAYKRVVYTLQVLLHVCKILILSRLDLEIKKFEFLDGSIPGLCQLAIIESPSQL